MNDFGLVDYIAGGHGDPPVFFRAFCAHYINNNV